MARVLVGYSEVFASIDSFAWSKISFKFFFQYLFCWLLTCVNHIYWIRVYWYLNVFSGVLSNFQRDISKPYIWICFPYRFVEGCGEGSSFCDFTCCHQYIDWIQGNTSRLLWLASSQSYQCFPVDFFKVYFQEWKRNWFINMIGGS